jgi:stage V sporulation protein B
MRAKKFILNTLLLTISSLVIRGIGLAFQIYLSNKIGAAGIGLFQLIMSVYIFAVTLAVSGVRFAVCRIVSEEIGLGNHAGIRPAVRRCLIYGLSFGLLSGFLLFVGAYKIGTEWVGDGRIVFSLRVLALSLPLISVSAVMGGYFTAVQRIIKSSSAQLFENLVRIAVVMFLLSFIPANNLEYACAAVCVGNVAGELLSVFLMLILYLFDVRRYKKALKPLHGMTKRILKLAMPLALSAYARTALGSLYHLLVPRGLQKSGSSMNSALATYGTISGMVLPLILYPIAVFTSIAEMLVPDLTEAQVRGDKALVNRIVNKILSLSLLFSIGIAGVFYTFSSALGQAVYNSVEAGSYIRVFAPLVVIMYMDTVTDGMLKGLGQQMHSMYINIMDAGLSAAMVYFLLPVYAVPAYVFIIWFTEAFNFAFSLRRLSKVADIDVPLKDMLRPIFGIIGGVNFSLLIFRIIGMPLVPNAASIVLHMLVSAAVYYFFLRAFSCIQKSDLRAFAALFKI